MTKSIVIVLVTAWCTVSPLAAEEHWPSQPIRWPDVPAPPIWPGDDRNCLDLLEIISASRPPLQAGQSFLVSRYGGLFFKTRAALDLFVGPLHALAMDARLLPPEHPLVALEAMGSDTSGGRAHDDLLGDGYVLMSNSNVEHVPRWDEVGRGRRNCIPVSRIVEPQVFIERHPGSGHPDGSSRRQPIEHPDWMHRPHLCPECERARKWYLK